MFLFLLKHGFKIWCPPVIWRWSLWNVCIGKQLCTTALFQALVILPPIRIRILFIRCRFLASVLILELQFEHLTSLSCYLSEKKTESITSWQLSIFESCWLLTMYGWCLFVPLIYRYLLPFIKLGDNMLNTIDYIFYTNTLTLTILYVNMT